MLKTVKRMLLRLLLIATLIIPLSLCVVPSAQAASGSISGRVTAADAGQPIADIIVYAYKDNDSSGAGGWTDSQGNFSITDLDDGVYTIYFYTLIRGGVPYKSEYYNNKDSRELADKITITGGNAVSGINATLEPYPDSYGVISGKVTSDSEPAGIGNVDVVAYDQTYRMISADVTNATGDYELIGLADGSYHVRFNPERAFNIYKEEWFDDADGFSNSILVEAKYDKGTTGIDAHLKEATSHDNRMKAVCMVGESNPNDYYSPGGNAVADYLENMGLRVERLYAEGHYEPSYDYGYQGRRDYALVAMEHAKIVTYYGHGGEGGWFPCFVDWNYETMKNIQFAENPVIILSGACYSAGPASGYTFTDEEMEENAASFANTFMGWKRNSVIDYSQKNNGFALYFAGTNWTHDPMRILQKLLSNQDYRLDELIDFELAYKEDPYRYNDESDPANPMKEDYRMFQNTLQFDWAALVGNFNLTTKDIFPPMPPPDAPSGFDATFYFAEGCTASGFQEYLTLGNPASSAADVQVLYLFANGDWQVEKVTVPAGARTTVDVNNSVGPDKDVSVRIASDQAIVAERPMYFNYNGLTGGSDVLGTTSPSSTWYFAEGYTGPGFDEWICVLNPGDTAADLTFRFQTQEEGEIIKTGFNVAPHSRATFKANDLLDGMTYQASLKLESSQPVVAERPMYFNYSGNGGWDWTGGHCVMGSPSLSKSFYFAEGTTRGGFEQWLTLQNPGTEAIPVDAVYQLGAGQGDNVTKNYTIGAGERATVFVENEVGAEKDVSVKLTSSSDFLAERPMYFSYQNVWTGGHCVIGAVSPEAEWFLAEGYTGSGFDEYVCLQNPGDTEATVRITYLTQEAGALAPKEIKVPAHSRSTVLVNIDAGADYQLSVKLEVIAGGDIVVERSMYFGYNGWTGGHDVVGYTP